MDANIDAWIRSCREFRAEVANIWRIVEGYGYHGRI